MATKAVPIKVVRRPRTPKQRLAVKVARDVIAQLRRYKFTRGLYMDRVPMDDAAVSARLKTAILTAAGQLQDVVDDVVPVCRVCLLGACLLSKVRVANKLPVEDVFDKRGSTVVDVHDQLTDVFERDDKEMIEGVFELSWPNRYVDDPESDKYRGLLADMLKKKTPLGRIAALMRNVVRNGGVLSVKPMTRAEWARKKIYHRMEDAVGSKHC